MSDFEKREKCGWLTHNQLNLSVSGKQSRKVCGACWYSMEEDDANHGMYCDHTDHQFPTHSRATCDDWSETP